jgi:hypothetical protein
LVTGAAAVAAAAPLAAAIGAAAVATTAAATVATVAAAGAELLGATPASAPEPEEEGDIGSEGKPDTREGAEDKQ